MHFTYISPSKSSQIMILFKVFVTRKRKRCRMQINVKCIRKNLSLHKNLKIGRTAPLS